MACISGGNHECEMNFKKTQSRKNSGNHIFFWRALILPIILPPSPSPSPSRAQNRIFLLHPPNAIAPH
jgi:hypothetical protein